MGGIDHSGAKSVTPGGSVAGGGLADDLLAVCVAIAPYLGATDENDWRGLEDDDAIAMPVKMRVGDLRALKAVIVKATAGETRNAEPIHRRDGDEG